jgi:glutaconate CoA-transferase, subunit A
MADVANLHSSFTLYITRHSPRSLVQQVEAVSARRAWYGGERLEYGLGPGSVELLTNLGRFRYDEDTGGLLLTHVHPGVTVDEVATQTGFPLRTAPYLAESVPPTADELRVLREEVDPFMLRRLEFVPSAQRHALISELLAKEEAALAELATATAPC